MASEFSSVEKISRWHKREKKEVRIGIWKKCVDIIPLFPFLNKLVIFTML